MTSRFCAGSTSARTSSICEARRHRRRGGAAVAGQHDDPKAFERGARLMASGVVELDGIGDAETGRAAGRSPGTSPSGPRGAAARPARPRDLDLATPASRIIARVPEHARGHHCTTCLTIPCPTGSGSARTAGGISMAPSRVPARGWQPRADARSPARAPPRAGSTSCSESSAKWDDRGPAAACPPSSVPVLSTTSVSTCSRRSSASAFLTRTPRGAPASGPDHDRHRRREAERARARDDQHGDRVDERVVPAAAAGPTALHATNVEQRDGDDGAARSSAATRSASRWIGARLRCASPTMRTI